MFISIVKNTCPVSHLILFLFYQVRDKRLVWSLGRGKKICNRIGMNRTLVSQTTGKLASPGPACRKQEIQPAEKQVFWDLEWHQNRRTGSDEKNGKVGCRVKALQAKKEKISWQQEIQTIFNFRKLFRKVQNFEGLKTKVNGIRTLGPESRKPRTLRKLFREPKREEAIITVTWHQKKSTGSCWWKWEIIRQNCFPFMLMRLLNHKPKAQWFN